MKPVCRRLSLIALWGVFGGIACGDDKEPNVDSDRAKPLSVYIGTYTRGWACPKADDTSGAPPCTSKGIYRATFDPKTGTLGEPMLAAESENPSYLALSPDGKFLYAVNEVGDFRGEKSGAVSAFAVDESGGLKLINQLSSHGGDPCHISLANGGRTVLVANYSGGNVSSYRRGPNGELMEGNTVANVGPPGPHKNQSSPHAHFIVEGPTAGLVYVADLGLDRVFLYDLNAETSQLSPHAAQPFVSTPPGSGPRHIAIHPNKKFLYTNNELTTAASTFAREGSGTLTAPPLQTISTIPLPFTGRNNNSEILLNQEGRFAYVSNRGHDSITTFSVNQSTGMLDVIENVASGGKEPRDFKIEPGGKYLLAAHQNSDEIVTFKIDPGTGKLERSAGAPVKASKPVNFAFWDGHKK